MVKPFTTETQRHRERQKQNQLAFVEYIRPYWVGYEVLYLMVFSVSLCLCGGILGFSS